MGLRCCRRTSTPRSSCFTVAGAEDDPLRPGRGQGRGRRARSRPSMAERAAHGPFQSLADLCRRIDLQRVNRRVLEALIRSGSLDSLGVNRATLMASLPDADAGSGEQRSRAPQARAGDLFGLGEPAQARARRLRRPASRCPSGARRCAWPASARRWACTSPATRSPRYERELSASSAAASATWRQRSTAGGGEGGSRWTGGKRGDRGRAGPRVRKRGNRTSFMLDDRSGAHRGHAVRGGARAVPRPARADASGAGRGQPALRRFQRRLAHRRAKRISRPRRGAREAGAAPGAALACRGARTRAGCSTQLEQAAAAATAAAAAPSPMRYAGDAGAQGLLVLGAEWHVRPTPRLMDELERWWARWRGAGLRLTTGRPACAYDTDVAGRRPACTVSPPVCRSMPLRL